MKIILIVFCLINAIASFLVISVNNPVYSVLFLILAFINSSIITFLIGHEFLAYILTIVYVGAIAILFLFIIMMLDIKTETSFFNLNYLFFPFGLLLFLLFLNQLYIAYNPIENTNTLISSVNPTELLYYLFQNSPTQYFTLSLNNIYINWEYFLDTTLDLSIFGYYIYKEYALYFILTGFILLIAMIGAIILTINLTFNINLIKNQSLARQISRRNNIIYFTT